MKKKLFVLTFAALAIVSFISKNNSLQSKSVILTSNVEAIAGDDDDPDLYTLMRMWNCYQDDGSWNMATTCTESGFYENQKCKISGELTVLGVTIKGSYEKGHKYDVPWARYTCIASTGNCCKKVGLYTGDTKLA
jgi:hypothetical protein